MFANCVTLVYNSCGKNWYHITFAKMLLKEHNNNNRLLKTSRYKFKLNILLFLTKFQNIKGNSYIFITLISPTLITCDIYFLYK